MFSIKEDYSMIYRSHLLYSFDLLFFFSLSFFFRNAKIMLAYEVYGQASLHNMPSFVPWKRSHSPNCQPFHIILALYTVNGKFLKGLRENSLAITFFTILSSYSETFFSLNQHRCST